MVPSHLRNPGPIVLNPSWQKTWTLLAAALLTLELGARPQQAVKEPFRTPISAHLPVILGEVRLVAVGDVMIFSEGQADPVARASLTYAIPPKA